MCHLFWKAPRQRTPPPLALTLKGFSSFEAMIGSCHWRKTLPLQGKRQGRSGLLKNVLAFSPGLARRRSATVVPSKRSGRILQALLSPRVRVAQGHATSDYALAGACTTFYGTLRAPTDYVQVNRLSLLWMRGLLEVEHSNSQFHLGRATALRTDGERETFLLTGPSPCFGVKLAWLSPCRNPTMPITCSCCCHMRTLHSTLS